MADQDDTLDPALRSTRTLDLEKAGRISDNAEAGAVDLRRRVTLVEIRQAKEGEELVMHRRWWTQMGIESMSEKQRRAFPFAMEYMEDMERTYTNKPNRVRNLIAIASICVSFVVGLTGFIGTEIALHLTGK
jgi:hypothetical protein